MSFPPVPGADWFLHSLKLQASIGIDGFALQDATPTIISWEVPDDGNLHRVLLLASLQVTSSETGGAVSGFIVSPGGGSPAEPGFVTGGQVQGNHVGITGGIAGPGTTVNVEQTSALTGGAAVLWVEIWGS
jgi:hypothetical protein